jgi:Domain of unknown function (DUF1707)
MTGSPEHRSHGTHPVTDDALPAAAITPAPLRASDGDRHATVEVLQDAVARGLLTPEEGSERMAVAYAARHLHDLPPLTADLPPAAGPGQSTPGWQSLAAAAWEHSRTSVRTLTAGGLRSPRTVAVLAGVVLALFVVVFLGAFGLHLLVADPHGHGGLRPHH